MYVCAWKIKIYVYITHLAYIYWKESQEYYSIIKEGSLLSRKASNSQKDLQTVHKKGVSPYTKYDLCYHDYVILIYFFARQCLRKRDGKDQ